MPGNLRAHGVHLRCGVRIRVRDGVCLNATLYAPAERRQPGPAVFTLTPYIGETFHERGMWFASRGLAFLTVDARGRGDSDGMFRPFVHEAEDAADVVRWVAEQPYCNGKIGMWGGSYGGFVQWAATKERAPLATIVPAASVYPGVDFPIRKNIGKPYWMQWLTFVSGRTSRDRIFADQSFWSTQFRKWFESGRRFSELDRCVGCVSEVFHEWIAHPEQDEYWDRLRPTSDSYAALPCPVLTITGQYDADQLGALTYYREHMQHASATSRSKHFLVIGPWDHAGTREPKSEFCGLKVGAASQIDLNELHLQWYAWTLQDGAKPEFLCKRVPYYVTGAERWRYADTLEGITARLQPLYLQSASNPDDSGMLTTQLPERGAPDTYVHDPRDVSLASLENAIDPASIVDQRMMHARSGKQLVYHTEPFTEDVEVSGFFRLRVWLAIDQPDTDFRVSVHEIALDGSSVLLSTDSMRARYRESLRRPRLIDTRGPLRYEFEDFNFVARQVRRGHRLRLVIGPGHSIYGQKNYGSGAVVSQETAGDARTVTVCLFHDAERPSTLYVPIGQSEE